MRAALLALALAGCASPTPDLPAIVRGEVAAITAKSRTVRCERRQGAPAAWNCVQRFPAHADHGAVLSIEVKPAGGALPDDETHLVRTSFGPGGSGSSFKGRTRDGRFDVLTDEMTTGLSEGEELALPGGGALIDRVLAAYDRDSH